MITDEMVEKARKIIGDDYSGPLAPIAMRAALEAVAPALIAQGMREAAELAFDARTLDAHPLDTELIQEAILARAQELDPK